MISANELRIGNVIQVIDGNIIEVESIDFRQYGINLTESCIPLYYSSDIYGIPLTEEILLKCGFEKINRHGEIYFLNGDCFELHQFNQYGHFSYTCGDNLKGNFVSTRIDSLHQLQNLYFALTGKELEIKI